MSLFFYNLFLRLYALGIRIFSLFNGKARKWVSGRKNWQQRLTADTELLPQGKRVWIHAASLGEFEQGRPVIEALNRQYPGCNIILSFFSPSGYEIRKQYELADLICYLPMDSAGNARDFIDIVKPDLCIFIKYEFWYHYMDHLHQLGIPSLLISAAFRKEQPFFRSYGNLFRHILQCFDHLFVQDEASVALLSGIGINAVTIAGDTRYDRVSAIAAQAAELPLVAAFKGNSHLVVAGSTWPGDEKILKAALPVLPAGWKLVIAPHEIHAAHIRQVRQLFKEDSILYSELQQDAGGADKRILIIDNIGMLSSLYRYGSIAFIGGGFQSGGIHNILEPTVFGLPVIFGPVYEKFVEANEMVAAGYAFPVRQAAACTEQLQQLVTDEELRRTLHENILRFMRMKKGATDKIMSVIDAGGYLAENS